MNLLRGLLRSVFSPIVLATNFIAPFIPFDKLGAFGRFEITLSNPDWIFAFCYI